jgi:hypothetical protein
MLTPPERVGKLLAGGQKPMTAATKLYYTRAMRRATADPQLLADGVAADRADPQRARVPAGLVEIYASEAARDCALGAVGRELKFVACTADDAAFDTAAEFAVGHVVGEEGFEAVLAVVAGRLAPLLLQPGPHRVIVNRAAYAVAGNGRSLGAQPLMPASQPSEAVVLATRCAIWRALGERVPSEQSEETSRANRATSRRNNAQG